MNGRRGPHNSGKCSFHIVQGDPLSAEASINQCVGCVINDNARLNSLREDFRQRAFLVILEEEPNYDPNHPSGASFITFIKSRVCYALWCERRRELKYLPYPESDEDLPADGSESNPLVASLIASACACEAIEDTVVQEIEVEQFLKLLPQMLNRLSEKEQKALKMKYFDSLKGKEIADTLEVSEGRVSQLIKSGLTKLRKAYLQLLEDAS